MAGGRPVTPGRSFGAAAAAEDPSELRGFLGEGLSPGKDRPRAAVGEEKPRGKQKEKP